MKPYIDKSVSLESAKEIILLYREKKPKNMIKYENDMFYIRNKKGEILSVLDYRTLKCQIDGTGIHIEEVTKERVKKVRKRR